MRFIIFVIDSPNNLAESDEMTAINAFNDGLRRDGQFVFAAGIGAPSTATLLDFRGTSAITENVSLFRDAEHYSGFWIIEANSEEQAHDIAANGSRACNRRVELRPFLS